MRRLVNIDEAKRHLRYDEEPPELDLLIEMASDAVLNYLGEDATFLDENGQVDGVVPFAVKAACLIWLGEMDKNREGQQEAPLPAQFGYGYPPAAVVALLYPLRDPRMA